LFCAAAAVQPAGIEGMDKFIAGLAAKLTGFQKLDIHRMIVHFHTL
jgi:hypothetical protein